MKDKILERIFIKDSSGEFLLLANAYPNEEDVVSRIENEYPLTFYFGIDPTGKELHIGHVVHLMLMKRLIALGHKAIILVGDFTARIGDPTGKDTTRIPLSKEQIGSNMQTYLEQITKILPENSFELKYNSAWLGELKFEDILKLAGNFTVQQMLERDMFQRRLKDGLPIGAHEFLYPLMQGYDSVAMDVDGEIGGNDQTFNMLAGRDLAKIYNNKEKIVLTSKMLADPVTGKKMGKTEDNFIAVNDEPKIMFDKIMNKISDEMVELVFLACTERDTDEIKELAKNDKRAFHEELAFELVSMFHSKDIAVAVRDDFKQIAEGGTPENMEEINPSEIALAISDSMKISKSEAKRLLGEGAVSVNGVKMTDWNHMLQQGDILKVGRRFFRVV